MPRGEDPASKIIIQLMETLQEAVVRGTGNSRGSVRLLTQAMVTHHLENLRWDGGGGALP